MFADFGRVFLERVTIVVVVVAVPSARGRIRGEIFYCIRT
jgi:hypothetical protein